MTIDVKLDSISLILKSADMLRPQSGCGKVNFLVPTRTQKTILLHIFPQKVTGEGENQERRCLQESVGAPAKKDAVQPKEKDKAKGRRGGW